MIILPAIDLQDGHVVRLSQGDYDRKTVYSKQPASVAEGFVEKGATWLHVVDLDGARDGKEQNRAVIAELCKQPLQVQTGGGIRTEKDVAELLALGVARVILGTLALTDFSLVEALAKKYGEKLAVGVDTKNGMVATHGWREVSRIPGVDFCKKLLDTGIQTVIYTDIAKDGQLAGTNLALYEKLQAIQGLQVIASGGVTFEDEIERLKALKLYGVILGKALYEGKLSLGRALAIAKGEQAPC